MKTTTEYPPTPELDRLKAVAPDSQKIGEFMDWLDEQGIYLCRRHEHDDNCYEGEGFAGVHKVCGMADGDLWPINTTIQNLLAQYFDIDQKKVEKERVSILNHIREQQ